MYSKLKLERLSKTNKAYTVAKQETYGSNWDNQVTYYIVNRLALNLTEFLTYLDLKQKSVGYSQNEYIQ